MRAPALNELQTVTCAGCNTALEQAGGAAIPFGQFWYHVKCLPVCRTCGRTISPDEEGTYLLTEVTADWASSHYHSNDFGSVALAHEFGHMVMMPILGGNWGPAPQEHLTPAANPTGEALMSGPFRVGISEATVRFLAIEATEIDIAANPSLHP